MRKKLKQEIDLIGNTLAELRNFQLTDKDAKMLASQLLEDLYNYSTGIEKNERKKKKVAVPKDMVTIKGYHTCKYCNDLVMGTNEDELCDECKMLFGHSLFTEL